jgi:fatty acid desaturase
VRSQRSAPTHLDDFLEYQEHSLNPYYYITEGKQPLYSKAKGKPLLAAVEVFLAVAIATFLAVFLFINPVYRDVRWAMLSIYGIFSAFGFFVGLGYVRKHKAMQEERRLRREKLRVRHKKRE